MLSPVTNPSFRTAKVLNSIMKAHPNNEKPESRADDLTIMEAIRSGKDHSPSLLKSFFDGARAYAMGHLKAQYPGLDPLEWEVVFANVNLKLVSRIKKGLELRPETKLRTYYVSVAKFAALDLVRNRKEAIASPFSFPEPSMMPEAISQLEAEERRQCIRQWLEQIIGHEDQLQVLLLQSQGYSFKEIVERTNYQSEGACRNALLKGKKKISAFILQRPESAARLKALLQEK